MRGFFIYRSMKEQLWENISLSHEFPSEDFLGGTFLFLKSNSLWKSGFEILQREWITDSVFHTHPRIFSRVLSMQTPNNRPRHSDGKSAWSIYESYLLDFLSVVKFEHQRQWDLDRKNWIHHEGVEARSIWMLEWKVETEIKRARKIVNKLRERAIPVITWRRCHHTISSTSSSIEKITRK